MAELLEPVDLQAPINLEGISVPLQQLLATVDTRSKQDIIEEIEGNYEKEDLLEERSNAFTAAKRHFKEQYASEMEQSETAEMILAPRNKSSGKSTIATEILDIYKYMAGYSRIFPREILAKSCKIINISDIKTKEKGHIANPLMDKISIVELHHMIKELQRNVNKLVEGRNEDKKKIEKLTDDISAANNEIKELQERGHAEKTKSDNIANPNENPNEVTEREVGEIMPPLPPPPESPQQLQIHQCERSQWRCDNSTPQDPNTVSRCCTTGHHR